MKKVLTVCLVLTNYSYSYGKPNKQKTFVQNEVLVRFVSGVSMSEKNTIRKSLRARKIKEIKSIRIEYWRLPPDTTTDEALEFLRSQPSVEYAEPNYLYKPHAVPNDPLFINEWFLRNTGQTVNGTNCKAGADISATEAWDYETGNSGIVIAVIDSGVAYEHPDLITNVWTNDDEMPGNGIDDDGNGYIDDVHGWDFVNEDNNPSDYSRDLHGDGHGTHVAGIIAA